MTRPILYLHPAGGLRRTRVIEALEQTHKVHMPVFPGFDGTPTRPGLNTRRELAKYVADTIGGACDVIGCSFGGAVALWLAIDRPELVDHLVLECPAGLQTIDPALRADPAAFRRALFAHPEKFTAPPKKPEIEAGNRKMLGHYGAEEGRDAELSARLSEIKCTTLILHGTLDRIITREAMQLLKRQVAKSFLVYVWDAAHNIEVDQPERMLALVTAFLERSEAFVVRRAG